MLEHPKSIQFVYKFNKRRHTVVEFEIGFLDGKKVAQNIKFISNWRANYPNNPLITRGSNGEKGFLKDGVWQTNGDIQQIIIRIEDLVFQS